MQLIKTIACMALAAVFMAPAAHAATDAQAVAALNQARAQIGVPPVALDPALSAGCAKHVAYMRATGEVEHGEDATNPNFSWEGAGAAASSVLAGGGTNFISFDDGNPWNHKAPLHMFQLLHPTLQATGYADDQGFGCMNTLARRDDLVAAGKTFNWPANGQIGVPYETSTENEEPNPGEQYFGWTRDRITGPYLMVFAQGYGGAWDCPQLTGATPEEYPQLGVSFSNVSLVGPDGPVEVRQFDDDDNGHYWRGDCSTDPYGPSGGGSGHVGQAGGLIVPVNPLKPSATYTAKLTITGIGPSPQSFDHSFSFTTAEAAKDPEPDAQANLVSKNTVRRIYVRQRTCARGRCVRRYVPRIRVTYWGHVADGSRAVRTRVAIRRRTARRALLVARVATNARGEWRLTRTYPIPARHRRNAVRWYTRQFPIVQVNTTVSGEPIAVRQRLLARR